MCGQGRLCRNWWTINPECAKCGADLKRGDGVYLGSIYINYGLTSLIVAVAYPLLLFSGTMSNDALLYSSLAFMLVCPLIFLPFARSLWLGFDQYCDPRDGEEGTS